MTMFVAPLFGMGLVGFLIGIVPAILWLLFWLREDRERPEPQWLIARAFAIGMVAVVVVIPFQGVVISFLPEESFLRTLIWATLEEVLKFALAWALILERSAVDEPIDMPVYMITVALGFAALENTLFILDPLLAGNFSDIVLRGDLRFIGATLIHVLASAVIGGALAFTFYRELPQKLWYGAIGLILAASLHTLFNFLIMTTGATHLLTIFAGVWVGVIMLLLVLERIKGIHRPFWWEKTFMNTTQ